MRAGAGNRRIHSNSDRGVRKSLDDEGRRLLDIVSSNTEKMGQLIDGSACVIAAWP
jgi:hypothetical protein